MINLGDNCSKNQGGWERNNMDQINPTVASWTQVEFLEVWV